MGKPTIDDFNGKTLDADSDRIFNADIQTKVVEAKTGKTLYLHAYVDMGQDSFLKQVATPLGKDKLRWVYWSAYSEEEQKRTGKKGEWVRYSGAIN